jgi:hypothetical protein
VLPAHRASRIEKLISELAASVLMGFRKPAAFISRLDESHLEGQNHRQSSRPDLQHPLPGDENIGIPLQV